VITCPVIMSGAADSPITAAAMSSARRAAERHAPETAFMIAS
jgi:hypothetical protein